MFIGRVLGRAVVLLFLTATAMSLGLVPVASAGDGSQVIETRAGRVVGRLLGSEIRRLPFPADDVAVYWKGDPNAAVRLAFSRDGVHFSRSVDAGRDEAGDDRANGITYGAVISTTHAAFVRIQSNRPLPTVTVLGLADQIKDAIGKLLPTKPEAPATAAEPPIISRSAWGADESLRFRKDGSEKWTPSFYPVEKLIVHHTAGSNNDPHPAATVRGIYYYHAITRDWGDIGYNFLIDEAGHIYKGRNSHPAGTAADTLNGENSAGNGVTGAHARDYNAGSVGVALLGTLTNQDATPAAKSALEDLLAWKAQTHHVDPNGASRYRNPVSGTEKVFPNIAGHRDVGDTDCPGGTFYATLPSVRDQVAARMR